MFILSNESPASNSFLERLPEPSRSRRRKTVSAIFFSSLREIFEPFLVQPSRRADDIGRRTDAVLRMMGQWEGEVVKIQRSALLLRCCESCSRGRQAETILNS